MEQSTDDDASKLAQHRDDWEGLGTIDPMWAVLSHKGREGGRWDVEEFYATGREQIGRDLEILRRHGLAQSFNRVLDFGCGLGRLTYAWAPHAELCTGVDISTAMIEGARRANRAANCEFVHNDRPDLNLFASNTLDLVGNWFFERVALSEVWD